MWSKPRTKGPSHEHAHTRTIQRHERSRSFWELHGYHAQVRGCMKSMYSHPVLFLHFYIFLTGHQVQLRGPGLSCFFSFPPCLLVCGLFTSQETQANLELELRVLPLRPLHAGIGGEGVIVLLSFFISSFIWSCLLSFCLSFPVVFFSPALIMIIHLILLSSLLINILIQAVLFFLPHFSTIIRDEEATIFKSALTTLF